MTKKKPRTKMEVVAQMIEMYDAMNQRRPETAPPSEKTKPKPKRQRPGWSPRANTTYPTAEAKTHRRDDVGWAARWDGVA
jgi:hypothetical protein